MDLFSVAREVHEDLLRSKLSPPERRVTPIKPKQASIQTPDGETFTADSLDSTGALFETEAFNIGSAALPAKLATCITPCVVQASIRSSARTVAQHVFVEAGNAAGGALEELLCEPLGQRFVLALFWWQVVLDQLRLRCARLMYRQLKGSTPEKGKQVAARALPAGTQIATGDVLASACLPPASPKQPSRAQHGGEGLRPPGTASSRVSSAAGHLGPALGSTLAPLPPGGGSATSAAEVPGSVEAWCDLYRQLSQSYSSLFLSVVEAGAREQHTRNTILKTGRPAAPGRASPGREPTANLKHHATTLELSSHNAVRDRAFGHLRALLIEALATLFHVAWAGSASLQPGMMLHHGVLRERISRTVDELMFGSLAPPGMLFWAPCTVGLPEPPTLPGEAAERRADAPAEDGAAGRGTSSRAMTPPHLRAALHGAAPAAAASPAGRPTAAPPRLLFGDTPSQSPVVGTDSSASLAMASARGDASTSPVSTRLLPARTKSRALPGVRPLHIADSNLEEEEDESGAAGGRVATRRKTPHPARGNPSGDDGTGDEADGALRSARGTPHDAAIGLASNRSTSRAGGSNRIGTSRLVSPHNLAMQHALRLSDGLRLASPTAVKRTGASPAGSSPLQAVPEARAVSSGAGLSSRAPSDGATDLSGLVRSGLRDMLSALQPTQRLALLLPSADAETFHATPQGGLADLQRAMGLLDGSLEADAAADSAPDTARTSQMVSTARTTRSRASVGGGRPLSAVSVASRVSAGSSAGGRGAASPPPTPSGLHRRQRSSLPPGSPASAAGSGSGSLKSPTAGSGAGRRVGLRRRSHAREKADAETEAARRRAAQAAALLEPEKQLLHEARTIDAAATAVRAAAQAEARVESHLSAQMRAMMRQGGRAPPQDLARWGRGAAEPALAAATIPGLQRMPSARRGLGQLRRAPSSASLHSSRSPSEPSPRSRRGSPPRFPVAREGSGGPTGASPPSSPSSKGQPVVAGGPASGRFESGGTLPAAGAAPAPSLHGAAVRVVSPPPLRRAPSLRSVPALRASASAQQTLRVATWVKGQYTQRVASADPPAADAKGSVHITRGGKVIIMAARTARLDSARSAVPRSARGSVSPARESPVLAEAPGPVAAVAGTESKRRLSIPSLLRRVSHSSVPAGEGRSLPGRRSSGRLGVTSPRKAADASLADHTDSLRLQRALVRFTRRGSLGSMLGDGGADRQTTSDGAGAGGAGRGDQQASDRVGATSGRPQHRRSSDAARQDGEPSSSSAQHAGRGRRGSIGGTIIAKLGPATTGLTPAGAAVAQAVHANEARMGQALPRPHRRASLQLLASMSAPSLLPGQQPGGPGEALDGGAGAAAAIRVSAADLRRTLLSSTPAEMRRQQVLKTAVDRVFKEPVQAVPAAPVTFAYSPLITSKMGLVGAQSGSMRGRGPGTAASATGKLPANALTGRGVSGTTLLQLGHFVSLNMADPPSAAAAGAQSVMAAGASSPGRSSRRAPSRLMLRVGMAPPDGAHELVAPQGSTSTLRSLSALNAAEAEPLPPAGSSKQPSASRGGAGMDGMGFSVTQRGAAPAMTLNLYLIGHLQRLVAEQDAAAAAAAHTSPAQRRVAPARRGSHATAADEEGLMSSRSWVTGEGLPSVALADGEAAVAPATNLRVALGVARFLNRLRSSQTRRSSDAAAAAAAEEAEAASLLTAGSPLPVAAGLPVPAVAGQTATEANPAAATARGGKWVAGSHWHRATDASDTYASPAAKGRSPFTRGLDLHMLRALAEAGEELPDPVVLPQQTHEQGTAPSGASGLGAFMTDPGLEQEPELAGADGRGDQEPVQAASLPEEHALAALPAALFSYVIPLELPPPSNAIKAAERRFGLPLAQLAAVAQVPALVPAASRRTLSSLPTLAAAEDYVDASHEALRLRCARSMVRQEAMLREHGEAEAAAQSSIAIARSQSSAALADLQAQRAAFLADRAKVAAIGERITVRRTVDYLREEAEVRHTRDPLQRRRVLRGVAAAQQAAAAAAQKRLAATAADDDDVFDDGMGGEDGASVASSASDEPAPGKAQAPQKAAMPEGLDFGVGDVAAEAAALGFQEEEDLSGPPARRASIVGPPTPPPPALLTQRSQGKGAQSATPPMSAAAAAAARMEEEERAAAAALGLGEQEITRLTSEALKALFDQRRVRMASAGAGRKAAGAVGAIGDLSVVSNPDTLRRLRRETGIAIVRGRAAATGRPVPRAGEDPEADEDSKRRALHAMEDAQADTDEDEAAYQWIESFEGFGLRQGRRERQIAEKERAARRKRDAAELAAARAAAGHSDSDEGAPGRRPASRPGSGTGGGSTRPGTGASSSASVARGPGDLASQLLAAAQIGVDADEEERARERVLRERQLADIQRRRRYEVGSTFGAASGVTSSGGLSGAGAVPWHKSSSAGGSKDKVSRTAEDLGLPWAEVTLLKHSVDKRRLRTAILDHRKTQNDHLRQSLKPMHAGMGHAASAASLATPAGMKPGGLSGSASVGRITTPTAASASATAVLGHPSARSLAAVSLPELQSRLRNLQGLSKHARRAVPPIREVFELRLQAPSDGGDVPRLDSNLLAVSEAEAEREPEL